MSVIYRPEMQYSLELICSIASIASAFIQIRVIMRYLYGKKEVVNSSISEKRVNRYKKAFPRSLIPPSEHDTNNRPYFIDQIL